MWPFTKAFVVVTPVQSTEKYIRGPLNDKISNQQKSYRATGRFSATAGTHPTIFPGVPFSFTALSTYVQSKFSAPSRRDDTDNGAKTATARRRMRRAVGKRWSQTKGGRAKGGIVVKKDVIAVEFGRTGTQESRKSLIRCSRQRNSSCAESRGKGEERGAREKGVGRRAASRLDLEGELKIASDYVRRMNRLPFCLSRRREAEAERSEGALSPPPPAFRKRNGII